jgi:hypothetical protein
MGRIEAGDNAGTDRGRTWQNFGDVATAPRGSRWARLRRFVGSLALGFVALSFVGSPAVAESHGRESASVRAKRLIERAEHEFKQSRFVDAQGLYRQAFALDSGASQALVMAGVAAFNAGASDSAHRDLTAAMAHPLSTDDRALAQTYLDILAIGDVDQATWQPRLRLAFAGGFDGNVRGTAPGGVDATVAGGAAQGAGFGSVSLGAGVDRSWDAVELGLGYELFQVGYPGAELASYNYQEHAGTVRVARAGRHFFAWELSGRADLSFTGLGARLRAFQSSTSGEAETIVGYNQPLRLRIAVGGMAIKTLDPSLAFLSGSRIEGRLVPEWSVAAWRLSLPLRWRRDWMGTLRSTPIETDPVDCPGCATVSVTPYGNQAWAIGARLMAPMTWRVRPSASARVERRFYLQPQHDELVDQNGGRASINGERRVDDRLSAGAALTARITDSWSAAIRYDYSQSDSTFVGATVVRDASRSYRKHVLSFEIEANWM